ncbi:MAG: hypothetical protein ACLPSF_01940 [Methylocella sp.]
MDVPTRSQGSFCGEECRYFFRRAKIAFDAGAPKIAQRRVEEGLNVINNCQAREAQRQARLSSSEETAGEAATELPCEADTDALAASASDRFAEFLVLLGRFLEEEERKTAPELAAFRMALLLEIDEVGGAAKA